MGPRRVSDTFVAALHEVIEARQHALRLHGPLRPGPDRWVRLLAEEWEEVQDELASIAFTVTPPQTAGVQEGAKQAAITELAQLAQLCIGVIELLQAGKITEQRGRENK